MKTISLSRNQLKTLAIIAMVVDHTAWGFVDFMSPLGQIMHILGRFTLPIMCFFIAEGYRHTSDLSKYIQRMITFAVISVIPFYLFFHEEYGYRQNIIFDLLLALLALSAMEHASWPKPLRIIIVAALIFISAVIGGWVIMPIIYVFIFYYGRSFKEKSIWFCFFTFLFEAVLIILIKLNQSYHFSKYQWDVTERLYLLGFVIALIPLYFYSGQKGKTLFKGKFEKYFFYGFYPCHFAILYIIQWLKTASAQNIYIWAHGLALGIGVSLFIFALRQPASKSQVGVTIVMLTGTMYIYGFILEITADTVSAYYAATKLQYFAEALVLISITYSMQELTHTKVPAFIYAAEGIFSSFALYCLYTYKENHLFYTGITVNTTAGPFPRMEILGYGPVFYAFVVYNIFVSLLCIGIGIHAAIRGGSLQKKRLRYLLFSMLSMWCSYLIKPLNLTKGYEIPALFIPITAFFLVMALVRYSYLDSISLDFSNAISRGQEGVLIVDRSHKVLYHNHFMDELLGPFSRLEDSFHNEGIKDIFDGQLKQLEQNGHTYELRIDPLIEKGHHTGDVLLAIDLTEHYEALNTIKKESTHDSLTGIHTRKWFEEMVTNALDANTEGAFFMLDLDHFKSVNDTYGHRFGDLVIRTASEAITKTINQNPSLSILDGRIGGDEFCLFIRETTDQKQLEEFAQSLMHSFDSLLSAKGYKAITSLSIGIHLVKKDILGQIVNDYGEVYEKADAALYSAKKSGRNTYRFTV